MPAGGKCREILKKRMMDNQKCIERLEKKGVRATSIRILVLDALMSSPRAMSLSDLETVLDTVGFDSLLQKADFVFTGEGKIDTQSLRGKVVIGVARRAVRSGVPVIAVVGDIGDGIEAVYGEGVSAVFSINRVAVDYHAARPRAKSDLALTMDTILRFSKICSSRS